MTNHVVSIPQAATLFDDRYFSLKAARDVFGIDIELLPIPFSWELLQRLSGDCLLVYYPEHVDGKPFRLGEMTKRALSRGRNVVSELIDPFHLSKAQFGPDGEILDSPYILPNDPLIAMGGVRGGWQLVSRTVVPSTKGKHLIETVDGFVDDAMNRCFDGTLPEGSGLEEALSEWNPERVRTKCESPCGRDSSPRGLACRTLYPEDNVAKASEMIAKCQIVGCMLEPLHNAVYRFLQDIPAGCLLFRDGSSRTSTLTSNGLFATFGRTPTFGGFIGQESPKADWPHLGALFSLFGQDIVPAA